MYRVHGQDTCAPSLESTNLYSALIYMRHNYEREQATIPRFKGVWAKWRVTRHQAPLT